MPAALLSILKGIGLSLGETMVLGTLLKEGPLTAAKVAEKGRMKRPTAYDTLRELVQKGLVLEIRDKAVLRFEAIDPDLLPNYIARKRDDLVRREAELRAVLQDLRTMKEKGKRHPTTHIIEGFSRESLAPDVQILSSTLPEVASTGVDIALGENEVIFLKTSPDPADAVSIEDSAITAAIRLLFERAGRGPQSEH